jgi:hypothetical protein
MMGYNRRKWKHCVDAKSRKIAGSIPDEVRSEMLRIPNYLDKRLTVNCEILGTCSSTYSPVRTSQEAHFVSIK